MAVAYLNDGATSLAAANWSDATGFANNATLIINSGTQSIQTAIDQSTISVDYLDILEGFSGTIGGAGGPLKCGCDDASPSDSTVIGRLRYWASGGALYYTADGNTTTLADYVQIKTGGRFYGVSGKMADVHLEQGEAFWAAGAGSDTGGVWSFMGGSGTIDYAASDAIPTLIVTGGAHSLRRNATTLTVGGGTITVDCQGLAIGTINHYGGRINLINSGGITTYYGYGGILDASRIGRPVTVATAVFGAPSAFTLIRHPLLTWGGSNLYPLGSAK